MLGLMVYSLGFIVITIIVVGIILWAINTYVPMHPAVKKILNIVVILVLIVWLLKMFGIWQQFFNMHI